MQNLRILRVNPYKRYAHKAQPYISILLMQPQYSENHEVLSASQYTYFHNSRYCPISSHWTIHNTTNQTEQLGILNLCTANNLTLTLHDNVHQHSQNLANAPSSTVHPCAEDAHSGTLSTLSTHWCRRPEIGNHEFSSHKTTSFTYPPH